jgi:pectin methylesterase-like acyl-CoA thioesterase
MVCPPQCASGWRPLWLAAVLVCAACGGQSEDDGADAIDPITAGSDAAVGVGSAEAGSQGDAASPSDGDARVASSMDARAPDTSSQDASPDAGQAVDAAPSTDSSGPASDAGPDASAPPGPSGPLFPAHMATDVCPDPELRIRTSGKPSLGNSGKIQVFESAAPGRAIAVVDLAVATISETRGGTSMRLPRPVFVSGNDVYVHLPGSPLTYGKTYYVTVDASAIQVAGGAAPTLSGASSWQFSTRATPPADKANLRVALDGSGDFCTLQGALDAVPSRSATATTIQVGAGAYYEAVHTSGKSNLTIRGEDRKRTIIAGVNNNNLNGGTATRALVSIDTSNKLTIENLTIHNLTPQGGSQAEALRLQGCDQCTVRDADILSLQDTLLWAGRIYARNLYVEGNVDYVWGTGAVFFDQCELKTVGRAGYLVQARNGAGASGYVFVDCKLTSDSSVTGDILGRIDVAEYPGSQVAFINCQMGKHIAPAGWVVTGGSPGASLRFQEYKSVDPAGKPIDVSRRLSGSTQLSDAEAMRLRNPAEVLGGWDPR